MTGSGRSEQGRKMGKRFQTEKPKGGGGGSQWAKLKQCQSGPEKHQLENQTERRGPSGGRSRGGDTSQGNGARGTNTKSSSRRDRFEAAPGDLGLQQGVRDRELRGKKTVRGVYPDYQRPRVCERHKNGVDQKRGWKRIKKVLKRYSNEKKPEKGGNGKRYRRKKKKCGG